MLLKPRRVDTRSVGDVSTGFLWSLLLVETRAAVWSPPLQPCPGARRAAPVMQDAR